MAVQIFKLRGVPEDEAEDIRELLESNDLSFYETSAGNWGISMPALWLHDAADKPRARELIDAYQKQRQIDRREAFAELKSRGEQPTLWREFRSNPLKFVFVMAAVIALLYFATVPWLPSS